MTKNLYFIIAIFFLVPAFGLAGGSFLSIWYAGVSLQPEWVKATNVLVVLVLFWVYIKSLISDIKKNCDYGYCLFAMIGLFFMPLVAGISVEGGFLDYGSNATNPFDGTVKQMSRYLALPFNCIYVFKTAIEPLWGKYFAKKKC